MREEPSCLIHRSSEEIAGKHEELICYWQDEFEPSELPRFDIASAVAVAVAEQANKV